MIIMERRDEGRETTPLERRGNNNNNNNTSRGISIFTPQEFITIRYRECQKNHAAIMGGHVVDGFGEFMPLPSGDSLHCAACDCHRNFHRKYIENNTHPNLPMNNNNRGPDSSSEEMNLGQPCSSKKRFRTKFSQEQKDKMHELAERLGWRMQKQNEDQVQMLCNQLGVNRQVFKVWMHNNKQAIKIDHGFLCFSPTKLENSRLFPKV